MSSEVLKIKINSYRIKIITILLTLLLQKKQEMTSSTNLSPSKQRIRIAATCLFIAQGLVFAAWASRLPDIKADFNVVDFKQFGYIMSLIPIGKFIAIPLVGYLFPRIGSKKTVLISILGFTLSLFVVGFISNTVYFLSAVMLFFGIFWNMTDISLNTQAIEVERVYGKSIIATFHASWSFAACVGALIGYGMINMDIIPKWHFVIISIFAAALILINHRYLPEHKHEEQGVEEEGEEKSLWDVIKERKLPETLLIQLGIIWLLALIVENTMFEWSDLYFQSVIKAPSSMQIGFLVFMIMMFSGRMITNYLYTIWKKITVLQVAGILIFLGFLTSSILIDHMDDLKFKVAINSFGFMMIGLGISCVVPTLYSIVAEKAKTPPGLALTIMSTIAFAGPLITPSLVGVISDHAGMDWAYLTIGFVGLCIVGITLVGKNLKN